MPSASLSEAELSLKQHFSSKQQLWKYSQLGITDRSADNTLFRTQHNWNWHKAIDAPRNATGVW